MWFTPLVLIVALLSFAFAHWTLRKRYPQDPTSLIDLVDQMLPQTQCAQCGYAGCRPYAAAVVNGEALNLCPPGGNSLYLELVQLMGDEQPGQSPTAPPAAVAVIDESQCIGCALCLPPCPVDAIVGAANKMHTVIERLCTGCELCIPACPVDCISLAPLPVPASATPRRDLSSPARQCINCGLCNPVCPVELPAQELLHALHHNNLDLATDQGLMQCIECGLCDRVCPSDIDMAKLFRAGKDELREQTATSETRLAHKARYAAHQARQQQQLSTAAEKRAQRLARARQSS